MAPRFASRGWPLLAVMVWLLAAIAPASAKGEGLAGRFDRGLLWRIDRAGPSGAEPALPPSYLFGTVHIDDPRATAFAPALRAALATSRIFMPELLPDAASAESFALATQLSGRQTLARITGDETFARVADLLVERYHLPPDDVAQLKPWAAYLYLSEPPPRDVAAARGEIVDAALVRMARGLRVPVRPLETVAEQVASLEAVPLASQLALLDALARHHDDAMAAVDRLVGRYLAQDLAGLRELEEAPAAADPALHAAMADFMLHMLDRRNERMLRALLPQLEQGGVFAAMGALHLQGDRGLLAMLVRAGWRVQRVD